MIETWWTIITAGILGMGLSTLVPLLHAWWAKSKRVKQYKQAISIEVGLNVDQAVVYLEEYITSPAYRLNTICYMASLPGLLADGGLVEAELDFLSLFYEHCRQLNASLDRIQKLEENKSGDAGHNKILGATQKEEIWRAYRKATHFANVEGGIKGKLLTMADGTWPSNLRVRVKTAKINVHRQWREMVANPPQSQ